MSRYKLYLTADELSQLKDSVSKLAVDTSHDATVEQSNKKLRTAVYLSLSAFAGISVVVIAIMASVMGESPAGLIVPAIISVLFTGIVEFLFLTFIVQNYKSIDSNYIKSVIIKDLDAYKKS